MIEFTAFICQDNNQEHSRLERERKLHPKLLPGFNSSGERTKFFCISIRPCTMEDLGLLHRASVQMTNNNVPVEIWFLQISVLMASLSVCLWFRPHLQVVGLRSKYIEYNGAEAPHNHTVSFQGLHQTSSTLVCWAGYPLGSGVNYAYFQSTSSLLISSERNPVCAPSSPCSASHSTLLTPV